MENVLSKTYSSSASKINNSSFIQGLFYSPSLCLIDVLNVIFFSRAETKGITDERYSSVAVGVERRVSVSPLPTMMDCHS